MTILSLARTIWRDVPRVLPLVRDARVPLALKIGAGVLAVLVVSPLDLFSDIPFLGLLDDAALLAILVHLFVALAERVRDAATLAPRDVTPAHAGPIVRS